VSGQGFLWSVFKFWSCSSRARQCPAGSDNVQLEVSVCGWLEKDLELSDSIIFISSIMPLLVVWCSYTQKNKNSFFNLILHQYWTLSLHIFLTSWELPLLILFWHWLFRDCGVEYFISYDQFLILISMSLHILIQ
jgi:hypothetical protein